MKIPVIFIIWAITWTINSIQLSSCDFEYPYRCEVIHTIGLVLPPISMATVWFSNDDVED